MDITKYLTEIEIPAADENQVNDFLAVKGKELNDYILKLWDVFLLEESAKNVVTVEIQDIVLPQPTQENLPIVQPMDEDNPPISSPVVEPLIPKPVDILPVDDNIVPIPVIPETVMNDIKKEDAINKELTLLIKNKYITLPNGKVGQPYNFTFSVEKIGLTEIEDFWFEGLEPIGLAFDNVTDTISGTPMISGECSIQLKLKRKGWTEGKPIFERKLNLTINPDPRSLWLNKPSDQSDPYWKQDSATRFLKVESTGRKLKTERKDVVAASIRGRSHAHEGIFRDDDFGMDYDKTSQWYIITVADGAGSAKASRKGSAIACETVVNVCKTQLGLMHKDFEHLVKEFSGDKSVANRKKLGDALYGIVGSAVFKAYRNIEDEAVKSARATKDFSTTLIVSICKKFTFGWFVGAFWVGDGGIGIYNKETRFLKVLGESDGGEFAGQTRFLTMPEITQPTELYRRLRFDIVEDFTALILMSDGITDPKFETDANLLRIEKWDELWDDLSKEVDFTDNNEKSADQLLKWLDFWSPGNHDDRTIAILF